MRRIALLGGRSTAPVTRQDAMAALSFAPGHGQGQGLTSFVRAQLGQLLREAYAKLPDASAAPPCRFDDPLARLTASLAALQDRDERTFLAEFEAFIPNLHRFAMKLTKNPAQADDLVQDTLFKAWRSRARFTIGTKLDAWLLTIMRNAFYSSKRKRSLEVSPGEDDRGEGPATVPAQLDSLDVQDVQRALTSLSEPARRALLLVTVDGRSYEQAAAIMDCRIGTVKSRVARAREQLSRFLGYGGSDLGADHVTLSVVSGARQQWQYGLH